MDKPIRLEWWGPPPPQTHLANHSWPVGNRCGQANVGAAVALHGRGLRCEGVPDVICRLPRAARAARRASTDPHYCW